MARTRSQEAELSSLWRRTVRDDIRFAMGLGAVPWRTRAAIRLRRIAAWFGTRVLEACADLDPSHFI